LQEIIFESSEYNFFSKTQMPFLNLMRGVWYFKVVFLLIILRVIWVGNTN
jgi:hypothetical protein